MSNRSSAEAQIFKSAAILATIVIAILPVIVFKIATVWTLVWFIFVSALCSFITSWIDKEFPNESF